MGVRATESSGTESREPLSVGKSLYRKESGSCGSQRPAEQGRNHVLVPTHTQRCMDTHTERCTDTHTDIDTDTDTHRETYGHTHT